MLCTLLKFVVLTLIFDKIYLLNSFRSLYPTPFISNVLRSLVPYCWNGLRSIGD